MSDAPSRPDIGFMLYEDLPPDFDADLVEDLASDGLNVGTLRIPGGPFAGIELYLPAVAAMYIGGAYFTGFIQKAGEDHCDLVKLAAKKLWRRISLVKVEAIGTQGKVSSTSFSLAYAIMGEVTEGLRFKFIVRTTVEAVEAEEGIQAFLDLLRDIHAGNISEDDAKALLTYRPVGGTVLVTFDPKARRIVPVNAFERE
jgi:hypothetical protein